jgi:hypothetical protein
LATQERKTPGRRPRAQTLRERENMLLDIKRPRTGRTAPIAFLGMFCGVVMAGPDGGTVVNQASNGRGNQAKTTQANSWNLAHEYAPNINWENGIAWDALTRRIVWHGGHTGRLYPQSNYTFLYDPDQNRFFESQAPARPQRRCLVHVAYLDAWRRVVTTDGGRSHGSIPGGGLRGDFRSVTFDISSGPWLYDPLKDTWEDCRTLPPTWLKAAHGPIAYEPGTDGLFALRGDKLAVFSPRLNRMFFRTLPPALHNRLGYGMTADPRGRRLIVFGGSAGGGYQWVRPTEDQTRDEALAAAYDRMVRNDTWIYDIVKDAWHEAAVEVSKRPPRGMPMSGMLSLQLVWHTASDTAILVQDAINDARTPAADRDPAQCWSFDPDRETWTPVPTVPGPQGRQPAFAGLLTYEPERNRLWLFGGGRDAEGLEGRPRDPQTVAPERRSRWVWSCRLEVPGRSADRASVPPPPSVETVAAGVQVAWPRNRDNRYNVFRSAADPFPSVYERLNVTPVNGGSFLDKTAKDGQVYAYRLAVAGSERRSPCAFNQLWRPAGVRVSVESANSVRIRWRPSTAGDVTGYKVYRACGKELEKGAGTCLTDRPVLDNRLVDHDIDLADGVVRGYWITAINRGGIESGASPLAYTVPDAPSSLGCPVGVGPSDGVGNRLNYVVAWDWPDDVKVAGFNVYHATEHIDTLLTEGGYRAFWPLWKKLTEQPVARREFFFTIPPDQPVHHYFYVRAVNVLGQEGFYTDIVSPTDRRFRP